MFVTPAPLAQMRTMVALLLLCGTAVAAPATNPCAVKNRINGQSTDGSGGTDTTFSEEGFEITGCNNTLSGNNATVVVVHGNNNVISGNEVRVPDEQNNERTLEIGAVNYPVDNSVISGNVAGAFV